MFDNINHKIYSDILPYEFQLTNSVPMGWDTFSVLTSVNVNSLICLGGERGGGVVVTFD